MLKSKLKYLKVVLPLIPASFDPCVARLGESSEKRENHDWEKESEATKLREGTSIHKSNLKIFPFKSENAASQELVIRRKSVFDELFTTTS